MIFLGQMLIAIGELLGMVLSLFIFLFFARAILSWVSPDPRNPIVQFINSATDPVLHRVRRRIPTIGMFDFSVIVVIFVLYFLQTALARSIVLKGQEIVRQATMQSIAPQVEEILHKGTIQ